MSIFRVLRILACAAIVVSCGNGSAGEGSSPQVPNLLNTVSSDALAVVCYNNCEEGMALMDSTNILRRIDYHDARDSKMVLSLCYSGSLVPVLAVDGGRSQQDTTRAVKSLMRQAAALRLQTRYLGAGNQIGGRNVLILTPSEAQMAATMRHIQEKTSILEAKDFIRALDLVEGHDFTIFRNSGVARYIPASFLSGIFQRRQTNTFLSRLAEWTVVKHTTGNEGYSISLSENGAGTDFAAMMETVPVGKSRLMSILPDEAGFAFAVQTPLPAFRKAYESYLDANVQLEKYNSRIASLKSSTGRSPLDWEKRLDICEAGILTLDGENLTLVRPSRTPPDEAPHANEAAGFPAALYGSAFELADESFCATMDGWVFAGSEKAVNRLFGIAAVRDDGTGAPVVSCKMTARYKNYSLVWSNKEIRLWNTHR